MTIYIATDIHGRGTSLITVFYAKSEFRKIAIKWLDRSGNAWSIKRQSTVNDICQALYDQGPGFGARHHYRINRRDALRLKNNGVELNG